jgi:hypothetical protein
MPTTNKFKEDSNIDGDLLPSDSKDREIVNTSTRDKKRPETSSWWINELDSLGIKKSSSSSSSERNIVRNESLTSQQLEDLTDNVKQKFIRDYKVCYNE